MNSLSSSTLRTVPGVLLTLLASVALGQGTNKDSPSAPATFVRPLSGELLLVGPSGAPDAVLDLFVHVAGGSSKAFVVIGETRKPELVARLEQRGVHGATVVVASGREWRRSDDALVALLAADAVWVEPLTEKAFGDPTLGALLSNTLARGGIVAAEGTSAATLVAVDPKRPGLGLLPRSKLRFDSAEAGQGKDAAATTDLQWRIPARTALLVHGGRKLAAYGDGDVSVALAARGEWPARSAVIEGIDVFDTSDELSYAQDLLAWARSAAERTGPVQPAAPPAKIELARGSLLLHGGGGVDDPTFQRFLELAGGDSAQIVCIPSAQVFPPGESPESYSHERLTELGCKSARIIHVEDPLTAQHDSELLAALDAATGVWIDGGRTYRFMDRFGGTRAAERIAAVLARGGVVGGSSAGCQVAGEFLLRGDPRSNRTLVFEGYTRGLELLRGVVLDAHFLQRDRGPEFEALTRTLPGLLGIGVDEDTAVLVQGGVAEVLGENQVTFVDPRADGGKGATVTLKHGQRYDLGTRARKE